MKVAAIHNSIVFFLVFGLGISTNQAKTDSIFVVVKAKVSKPTVFQLFYRSPGDERYNEGNSTKVITSDTIRQDLYFPIAVVSDIKFFRLDFGRKPNNEIIIYEIIYNGVKEHKIFRPNDIFESFSLHTTVDLRDLTDSTIVFFNLDNNKRIDPYIFLRKAIGSSEEKKPPELKLTAEVQIISEKADVLQLFYSTADSDEIEEGYVYPFEESRSIKRFVRKSQTLEKYMFEVYADKKIRNLRLDFGSKSNNRISIKQIALNDGRENWILKPDEILNRFYLHQIKSYTINNGLLEFKSFNFDESVDPFIYLKRPLFFPFEIIFRKAGIITVFILSTFVFLVINKRIIRP